MKVKYFDYLGAERIGTVVCSMDSEEDDNPYLFIKEEDDSFNKETVMIDGKAERYAEMRKSTECILLEE